MKVAFYSTYILEYGGGFEKYLIETAAYLTNELGVTADIITMDDAFMSRRTDMYSAFYMKKMDKKANYKEDIANIRARLGDANYYKVGTFKQLRKKLQNYDVVYTKNELVESFIFKFIVGYKHIPPVVFGGHTPLMYPNPESFHAKLHNFLYSSWLYKYMAGPGRRFHAINAFEADRYQQLFPKREVFKIFNPFDIARFKQGLELHDRVVSDAAINVMWVGRLTEQKGVKDLVEIVRDVNKELQGSVPVVWNIFGDGEERQLVEDLAAECDNVRYHGHVDQKKMAEAYGHQQLFLSTSKWEGYPYTLIEMQAFGLQGFAYDIPGPSDIFSAYEGGHIAKTKQEMIQMLVTALTQYKTAQGVPQSQASDQFEPQNIYGQLRTMLDMGEQS